MLFKDVITFFNLAPSSLYDNSGLLYENYKNTREQIKYKPLLIQHPKTATVHILVYCLPDIFLCRDVHSLLLEKYHPFLIVYIAALPLY